MPTPKPLIVSLAEEAAKLHSVEHRPKDHRMTHHQATLDGIEARYGRSRLSELLREQLERWPAR
jgi:hypothetical protein